jgi:hypothetical protein
MPPNVCRVGRGKVLGREREIGCSIAARGRVPRVHPFSSVEPYDNQNWASM